jgi:hypothetical protein
MGQVQEFDSLSVGEETSTAQFTCCDCNETLGDHLEGYHNYERCIACEAELIEIGLSVKNSQVKG